MANGKVFMAAGDQGLVISHLYQPIRFEQVARHDNGAVRLRLSGPPDVPGHVQRSDDLDAWTNWLPVNFGESPVELSDPEAASVSARFYRVTVP